MLFENEVLLSKYDFGQKQIENMNMEDLCREIRSKSRDIYNRLEQGEDIYLHHKDNKGKAVIIPHENYEDFYTVADRTTTEIKDMIERAGDKDDPSHSTIAKSLYKLGICKPEQGEGYEYAGYFRLLYFFYMINNFVYPNNNILLLIGRYLSTDLVPVSRAGSGDMLFFIRENLFDDTLARMYFYMCYDKISECLSNLWKMLSDTLSEDTIFLNKERSSQILERVKALPLSKGENECFPVYDMLNHIYSYEKKAYTSEMLKTINEEDNPFRFDIPDEDLCGSWWDNRYICVDKLEEFLGEVNLLVYCKQKTSLPKDAKYNFKKSKAVLFISKWIMYDREQMQDYQTDFGFFIEKKEGREIIEARKIAAAIKTYDDLDMTLFTKRYDRTYNRWRKNIKIKKALSGKEGEQSQPIMLAMDLFNIACISQYESSVYPGGYKYFFKEMFLARLIIFYSVMNNAFKEMRHNDRIAYFEKAIDIIRRISETKK